MTPSPPPPVSRSFGKPQGADAELAVALVGGERALLVWLTSAGLEVASAWNVDGARLSVALGQCSRALARPEPWWTDAAPGGSFLAFCIEAAPEVARCGVLWVEGAGRRFGDADARKLGALAKNLLERRALEQQRAVLSQFVDLSSCLLVRTDAQGRALWGNRSWRETFGETFGQGLFELVAEAYRDTARHCVRAALAGESVDDVLLGLTVPLNRLMRVRARFKLETQDGPKQHLLCAFSDVTEKLSTHERFQEVFEHSSEAHVLLGEEGVIDCNQAMLHLLQLDDRADLLRKMLWSFSPKLQTDGSESFAKGTDLERTARSEGNCRFDWVFQTPAGTEVSASVSLSPITLGGKPALLAVCQDLTEREWAERALQESEARFRALNNSAPVGIFLTDVHARCQYVNAYWSSMSGLSLAEAMGDGWLQAVHPDDRDELISRWAEALRERRELMRETRYVTREGEVRSVQLRASILADIDGRLLGCVGTVVDITQQKKSQEALRRLTVTLDGTLDLITIVDASTLRFTYVNQGVVQSTGYSAEALMAMTPGQLLPAFPDARMREWVAPLVSGEKPSLSVETVFRTRRGEVLPIEMRVQFMVDDEGKGSFVTVARDITERKAVERLKNEFVSTVSHELRTPLTAIRGALRLIEGGVTGEVPPATLEMVNMASANSERLIRLINDILDLEKIEAGKLELKSQLLDPTRLLAIAQQNLAVVAAQAKVQLVPKVHCPETLFRGDEDRLVQVLVNLMSNALKFSPAQSEVHVEVSLTPQRTLRFEVRDRGPGIPAAALPKLFGKFQQLDSSDTRQKGGTGLGLAISKAIVEQHGGAVGVRSTPGQGSTFWFEVPVPAEEAPATGLQPTGARYQVLVLEDDPELAKVLRVMLGREGYRALYAQTVAQAERLLEEERPDAVLLDVQLPDGNGLELLERMQRSPHGPKVPAVVLSGREQGSYGGPLLMAWFNKPHEDEELLRALRRAVRAEGQPKVLVAEDDDSARKLMVAQLRRLGVECLEASDGRQAVELAREGNPDLIILDVGMPQGNGFEVVELLRQEKSRGTPLVVYTGRDLSPGERESLRLGVTRHLTKSRASEEELVGTVRELLNGLLKAPDVELNPGRAARSGPSTLLRPNGEPRSR